MKNGSLRVMGGAHDVLAEAPSQLVLWNRSFLDFTFVIQAWGGESTPSNPGGVRHPPLPVFPDFSDLLDKMLLRRIWPKKATSKQGPG